jgi:peptide/nickel transport system substrate-binding protein
VIRPSAVLAAIAVALLAVSGAGGAHAQTPKRGGTVVVALIPPEPACLNIATAAECAPGTSGGALLAALHNVLESPFDMGPGWGWRQRLVSKVDFTKKRPFTITYHIRPEARWSDDVPVTADDFLYTLRAVRKFDPDTRKTHKAIRSIRVVDSKTVRLVLRPRFADWRSFFGSILPSHVLRGTDLSRVWMDRIDDPKTGEPIGSGPFLVDDWDRGKAELVLRRNPNYWGSHRPYLERLVVRFGVDGNDLPDLFRQGRIDVAYGFPYSFLPGLRREPGLRITSTPGVSWDHFEIRLGEGGHPALRSNLARNKLVRQALAYGIDRTALARELFADIDLPRTPSQSAVYIDRSPSYKPNWATYSFRPALARKLLERAGCSRGTDGIYSCGGERLSIRFSSPVVPGGFRPRVLEIVSPQLRQTGIELVPEFMPPQVLFDQVLPSGRFQVAIFGWTSLGPAPFGKDTYGCGGPIDYSGYCQRLVTRDLDQAQRILDPHQQALVMNRADAQMAKDVPVIPLYQPPVWAASRRELRGFAPSPSVLNVFADAQNWWLDR